MTSKLCLMFGLEVPIFAFSHCRDVVVEVSKAGGMGVLGVGSFDKEQLERELKWIDDHIDGRPYGVDILMPNTYDRAGSEQRKGNRAHLEFPAGHLAFTRAIADRAGLPPLPEAEREALLEEARAHIRMTPEDSLELLETAFRHPIKLLVNALGTPPKPLVDRAHGLGIKVGSLIGKVEHAKAQLDAGVDIIVAQGTEAGGHTGSITSMVLWPQVVDAVAPVPVLAAGGVGRGRQMAAALALGADGVWCGSIWLGTRESEVIPEIKERFFAAKSEDAVRSRALTGKPCRVNKSLFTDAWEAPDAPPPLPMPMQSMLNSETRQRIMRAHARDYMSYPVGQIVGDMNHETSVRSVIQGMLTEYAEASERMTDFFK